MASKSHVLMATHLLKLFPYLFSPANDTMSKMLQQGWLLCACDYFSYICTPSSREGNDDSTTRLPVRGGWLRLSGWKLTLFTARVISRRVENEVCIWWTVGAADGTQQPWHGRGRTSWIILESLELISVGQLHAALNWLIGVCGQKRTVGSSLSIISSNQNQAALLLIGQGSSSVFDFSSFQTFCNLRLIAFHCSNTIPGDQGGQDSGGMNVEVTGTLLIH